MDRLRQQLSNRAGLADTLALRTYTYPQTCFLLAVAEIETFRAQDGDPSQMLGYFHNEGVNNSGLRKPLASILTKVGECGHVTQSGNDTFAGHRSVQSIILAESLETFS